MMGQEHISYIQKYDDLVIDFLCDPNEDSIEIALSLIHNGKYPRVVPDEKQLLEQVTKIDLLVIASPNYMHTPQLLCWSQHEITILVEKPVAISEKQVSALKAAEPKMKANIWVAMEYRFIPAINKLIQHLPEVGEIKKVTIRENRYPFLTKIQEWNKDVDKSGDTLVEKCCHFFDLFRLITGQEMQSCVSKGRNSSSELFLDFPLTQQGIIKLMHFCYFQFTEVYCGIIMATSSVNSRKKLCQLSTVPMCYSTLFQRKGTKNLVHNR
mmetsp:Transcript_13802/g.28090  ORF Transcript_13802/g.28090 Transcript_13802/m.28090 type:complete len:268 (+) Transcript_13802:299-1102(+)